MPAVRMPSREIFDQLRELTVETEQCATFYESKPGLVQPATISDLYRAIGRLAAIVSAAVGTSN